MRYRIVCVIVNAHIGAGLVHVDFASSLFDKRVWRWHTCRTTSLMVSDCQVRGLLREALAFSGGMRADHRIC
jgi:hypothetical protein